MQIVRYWGCLRQVLRDSETHLLLVLIAAVSVNAQERPSTLGICDVRVHPHRLLGKSITVTGEVTAESHGTGLSDTRCDLGVVLVESSSYAREEGRMSDAQRLTDMGDCQ